MFRSKEKEKPETVDKQASQVWVWEFSKRLVLICTLIYVAEQCYAALAMWRFSDFMYLGTMMEQSSEIMRSCVFGYLVKAGIENTMKIWNGKKFRVKNNTYEKSGSPDDVAAG